MTTTDHSHQGYLLDQRDREMGYVAVRRLISDLTSDPVAARDHLLVALARADVKGCGGPGARTGKKFAAVLGAPGTIKYVVANGDESEPGAFKDKALMEKAPQLLVAGTILGALVVGAEQAYIYIRHEYPEAIEAVSREIVRATALLGINGPSILGSEFSLRVEVFESAGGYICGDQTAILEAIEGRRAEPRNRPPEPEDCGLYGRPTLVSNVETLSWVALIAFHGGVWYRELGMHGAAGCRLMAVSGNVREPGVYEVANGTPLRDLIFGCAGGVTEGQTLKAVATSGPSGGFIPAQLPVQSFPADYRRRLPQSFLDRRLSKGASHINVLDLELDLGVFRGLGLALGGGIVVYDDRANMLDQALNASEFFRNESCGRCVPCRLGTQKLVEIASIIRRGHIAPDALQRYSDLVNELLDALEATSICGLGTVAARPLSSVLRYFPNDLIPTSGRLHDSPDVPSQTHGYRP